MVIEKTARELRGTPCLDLEEVASPKQEICCSRMFGKRLREQANQGRSGGICRSGQREAEGTAVHVQARPNQHPYRHV